MGILDVPSYSQAQADARFARGALGADLNGTVASQKHLIPTFVKSEHNPMFDVSMTAGAFPNLYWPSVMNVKHIPGRLADYYMWFSTDHSAGAGGIGLAKAPSPEGPWTYQALVYTDTVSGTQTETPHVVWNSEENLFFMFYSQQAVAGTVAAQVTLLATSPDGITWTRVGVVFDIPYSTGYAAGSGSGAGGQHTGYALPFRWRGAWYAISLLAGGNHPHFALWTSQDARTWALDPRPLGPQQNFRPVAGQYFAPTGNLIEWLGQLFTIGINSNFASGGAVSGGFPAMARMGANLRSIISRPQRIGGTALQAWELESTENTGSVLVENGKVYSFYVNNGKVGLMIGTAE